MSNVVALEAFLAANPISGPRVALARSLALAIDDATPGWATVVKPYWALLNELAGDAAPADDADDWLRSLSAEVGDTPQP